MSENFSKFKIDKTDKMRRRKFFKNGGHRAREQSQGYKLQRDRNPRA